MTAYPLYSCGKQRKTSTSAWRFHPTQPLTEWLGRKISCLHDTSSAGEGYCRDIWKENYTCSRRSINHRVLWYHDSITMHCFHVNGDLPQKQWKRNIIGYNPVLSQILTEADLFLPINLKTNFHWKFFTAPMPLTFSFGTFLLGVLWKWQCASHPSCRHQLKSVPKQSNLHLDEHLPRSNHINTFTLRRNSLLVR